MPELKKESRFWKVTKALFFTRFTTNLMIILIIIAGTVVLYEFMRPNGSPSGNVVAPLDCPICQNCTVEECENDCSLCPVRTVLEEREITKYSCPDGNLVEDLQDCEDYFPEVDSKYSGTVEGITMAITNIDVEKDTDTSGFVTGIDYTIINKGEFPIVPKIEVKVYEEWSLKVKKSVANKEIYPEIIVNPNDYVERHDRVRIYFQGNEQTLRLLLVDQLPMVDRDILAVTRKFTLE